MAKNTRGSPLVEEALLIALAVIGVILVISYVLGLIDWLIKLIDQSIENIGNTGQEIIPCIFLSPPEAPF